MATITSLYKLRFFSLDEVRKEMGMTRSAAAGALQRWQSQGVVQLVRRNLYVVIDPASETPVADKYEVATNITEDSYIGWHTALEFHGLAHQPFYNAYVGSTKRFAGFQFDKTDYVFCQSPFEPTAENGIVSSIGNPYVKVTNLERTVVDCCERVDRSGGIEELMHSLEAVTMFDEQKLRRYLELYGKAFLYQKVGFVLEQTRDYHNISKEFVELCRERGALHTKRLTNAKDSDMFVKEWKLYVPKDCVKKEEDIYELI